jgi:hypothetical protein
LDSLKNQQINENKNKRSSIPMFLKLKNQEVKSECSRVKDYLSKLSKIQQINGLIFFKLIYLINYF